MPKPKHKVSLATRQQNLKSVPITPLTAKEAEKVMFTPSPQAPVDHEIAPPNANHPPMPTKYKPTPKPPQPPASASVRSASNEKALPMNDAVKPTRNKNEVTDSDVARYMPESIAKDPDLRNNEIIRKRVFYFKKADERGKSAEQAELNLIGLAEDCVDGAVEGALSVTDDSNEHAMTMYRLFNARRSKVRPQTEGTIKNKARQLGWFIKLGQHYKNDAKKFFNDVRDLHDDCVSKPEILKDMKYTAVFENVNEIVRKQMMAVEEDEQADLMGRDEQFALMMKPDANQTTAIDDLISAYKALERANDGKKANESKGIPERLGLKSPKITDILQSIQDFVQEEKVNDKAKFFSATAHKKPGKKGRKKKAAPAATATTATVPPADQEPDDLPDGFTEDEEGIITNEATGEQYTRDEEGNFVEHIPA